MIIKNCAAIVTGGASGMGAETARHLAVKGAKVTIVDTNIQKAEQVAAEIGGLAINCDVADADAATQAVDKAESVHGPVRICINCAGIGPVGWVVSQEGPMPLDEFHTVIKTNLMGTFNFLRLTAAQMSKQEPLNEDDERGVIINTASVAAYEGQIGQTAYSASKSGVVGLTLPAARELGQLGIRVVTIAPGAIDTPILEGMPAQLQASLVAQTPFPKRLGRPSEFAQLALHILENPFLNGCVLRLDGSIRAQLPPNFSAQLNQEFLPD